MPRAPRPLDPSSIDRDALRAQIPTGPLTIKLDHPVDNPRHRAGGVRSADAPKEPAKISEIQLALLRFGDLEPIPLDLASIELLDLVRIGLRRAGLDERVARALRAKELGRVSQYVAAALLPLQRRLFGDEGDGPPEIEVPTGPVEVALGTKGLEQGGEALASLTIQELTGAHLEGFPLDPRSLTFGDCMEIAGRASGLPPSVLKRLDLADTGAIVEALSGFLLELRAT